MDNKINFSIPVEVISEATTKLNEVVNILKPYLVALTTPNGRNYLKLVIAPCLLFRNAWIIASRIPNLPLSTSTLTV